MKTKYDFITNSSSSSFVIPLDKLTAEQFIMIENHLEVARKLFPSEFYTDDFDRWNIRRTETSLEGFTIMDNFDMNLFMEKIGIDMKNVDWDVESEES